MDNNEIEPFTQYIAENFVNIIQENSDMLLGLMKRFYKLIVAVTSFIVLIFLMWFSSGTSIILLPTILLGAVLLSFGASMIQLTHLVVEVVFGAIEILIDAMFNFVMRR